MVCPDCGRDCRHRFWSVPFSEYFQPLNVYARDVDAAPVLITDWAGFTSPQPFPPDGFPEGHRLPAGLTWRDTGMVALANMNSALVFLDGQPVGQIGSIASGGRQLAGSSWVHPALRGRGLMIAMYTHSFRNGWIVCGAYAPYRRVHRPRAAASFIAKAYRGAVEWAVRDGEAVPDRVRQNYLTETEVWIMPAKEADQRRKHLEKLKALRTKASAASRAGTPTWVDESAMKVTTVPPRERPRVAKGFAAKRRAAREAREETEPTDAPTVTGNQ